MTEIEERARMVADAEYEEFKDIVLASGVEYGYIKGFNDALNIIKEWIDSDSNEWVQYGEIYVRDVIEYIEQLKKDKL